MSRQILTFAIVAVGIMLIMRQCAQPPPAGGPAPEAVAYEDDSLVLTQGATEVRLAGDGTIVSVIHEGVSVIAEVPATRRTFHLLRRIGPDNSEALATERWLSQATENGRVFTYTDDAFSVTRTIRIDDGGVTMELAVTGADANGLILTGVSGVPLSSDDETARNVAYWQLEGGAPEIRSFSELSEARLGRADFADRRLLSAGEQVARFGVLGRDSAVALEQLPAVPPLDELFVDVYRAGRDEGEITHEIETWMELTTPDGNHTGTYRLRWTPRAKAKVLPDEDSREATIHWLENEVVRVGFTDRGAAIHAMWLRGFSIVAGEEPNSDNWIPILREGVKTGERALTLSANRYGGNPARDMWTTEVAENGRSITFTLETPLRWRFVKRVTLPEPGRYDLGVEIEVTRPAGSGEQQVQYTLTGPAGSYIADCYRGIIGVDPPAGVILERSGGSNEEESIDSLDEPLVRTYGEERWLNKAVGTRGAYFFTALVTLERGREGSVSTATAEKIDLTVEIEREEGDPSSESMRGKVSVSVPFEGDTAREEFQLYAGPTATEALRELGLEDAIHFGLFGFIGRILMWLLKFYQGIVGSWGVAIMLMTLTVRGILLPVSFKTQLSMQRYSKRLNKIKPLLDELQKKYGSNPQKMNQERMKVMKEHGVGLPLGCLTMLVQIPIWFALFQALRVEFAIRHQSFLWVQDLSMPDHLFHMPFFADVWLLPEWFNLLPILMLVLWVTQQRLAPTPGGDDPQVKMQMKMMKFMPFVFFFMLYNYTAALALYMCVSSMWSITEAKLVRRAVAKMD